jgi:hypothetical protein
MALVAHQDDRVTLLGELPRLDMDLGDERAGRVDGAELALLRVLVDARSDAVGGEDDHLALRHLGLLLDEDRPPLLELAHDVLVVDDLLAHVDRLAVERERVLDGLDGTIDARAVAPRCREQDPRWTRLRVCGRRGHATRRVAGRRSTPRS